MNIKLIMMMESVRSFFKQEEGASAIEYALIAGIIAVGILLASEGVRDSIIGLFGTISDSLDKAKTPAAAQ